MMNSANPADADAGPGRDRCCEPGVLEEIACRATGIEAQAEYNKVHAQALKDAQVAYAGARARYAKARHDAAPLVAKARKDLDVPIERIRCQLEEDDRECLERAFAHVVHRLERCGAHQGCCCDDLDDVEDSHPDDVPGRRAMLERTVAEATECFHRLIAEPGEAAPPGGGTGTGTEGGTSAAAGAAGTGTPAVTAAVPGVPGLSGSPGAPAAAATAVATPAASTSADGGDRDGDEDDGWEAVVPLPERVTALQAEIHAIASAPENSDPAELYAAALVAERHLDTVWHGFGNVNDYVDCLCRSLTCMVKGHAAISILVRKDAVHYCYRDAWRKACKRLEKETAAEVVAEYLRICTGEDPCAPDDDCHDHDHHDHDHHDHDHHDHGERPGYGDRDDYGGQTAPMPEPEPAPPPRRGPRQRRRPYTDESGGYRAP
jgi:hypothetical protein